MTLGIQKAIGHWLRKTKIMPIRNTRRRTKIKIRLSPIILFLLIISLRPRLPRTTSVIEAIKEAIQLLGSMLLR